MPTNQRIASRTSSSNYLRGLTCLVTGFLVVISGCSSSSNIYYWGNYEPLVYKMYNKPGDATPEVQIDKLSIDIQQAENRGKPIHPGLYAHLGMMYAAVGNMSDAMASFEQEKALFPESTALIDGMMNRVTKGNYSRLNKNVLPSGTDKTDGAKP